MKMTKKVFSAIVATAMVAVTAIPVMPKITVEAAASPIAAYDFESGLGDMSSSGIAGSAAPEIVDDAERGKVLKIKDGTSSRIVTKADDSSLGDYDMKIEQGTPSSLKFANPFAGKSLSGITVSFWVKVPDDNAASIGSGLIGFVSGSKTVVHPDKLGGDPAKQGLEDAHGPYLFGITCAYANPMADIERPIVEFEGLHHNSYSMTDPEGVFLGQNIYNKWQYVTVTMNNSYGQVYVDGKLVELDEYKNKRWNDGEVNGGTEGNVGQSKFLEFISWSDTQAYIGYTGFSPTSETYLDDITFYASELSAAEVSSLYQTAVSGGTTTNVSNGSGSSSSDAAKQQAAAEAAAAAAAAEAAAVEANKELTDAIVATLDVKGMPSSATKTVTPIYRGDTSYTSVVSALSGVVLRSGYRVNNVVAMNISFGGVQPETTAKIIADVPSGFDANALVVARINDDGTVSILKHTIEDGKIVAKTNHFSTYAIVNLEPGTPGTSSDNLPKTGAVASGAVVAIGAVSALCGTVLLKKRKEDEV